MARDGTVTVKITGDSKGLNDALNDSDGHLSKFGGKMGSVAKGIGAGFAGLGVAAVGFGVASVKAFMEAEEVAAQTGAVIKSTGGAAKVTAGDVDTLASSLAAMSGVDDELIAAGENLLLTFTKVRNETGAGNDVFNQATKAALDMSVAMGTDMTSASMLVGKALNDPLKGMTALTRSGIQFTEEQKNQVKAMVASGDQMGAQKIILKELETQFGGSAKAAGDTFSGQLNKLKVVAGDLMEQVGARLVPILSELAKWLADHLPAAIDRAGEIFNTLKGYFDDGKRIFDEVRDAISGLVERFTSGSGQLGESGSKIGEIIGQVKEVFASAFDAIKAIVGTAVAVVTDIWDRFGKTILEFIKGTWNAILEVIRGALNVVTGIFDLIKAVLTGKWGEAWEAIKKILDGAWDALFGVIRNALTNVIPTLFEAAKALLSAAFSLIWNALKTIVSDAVGWIGDRVGDIVGFFGGLGGRIAGAAGDFLRMIRDRAEDAKEWIFGKVNQIVGFFLSIPGRIANVGRDILSKLIPDLPGAGIISSAIKAIPGFATGGVVPGPFGAPMLAMVHGGETIIPAGSSGGGGGTTVVNFNIYSESLDPAAASEVVITAIKEYERRNGTDWRVA